MSITFNLVSSTSAAELENLHATWMTLLDRSDVEGSVFCDPRFLTTGTPTRRQRQLFGLVGRDGDATCCVIPCLLETQAFFTPVPGLRIGSSAIRKVRFPDFDFPMIGGFDRRAVLQQALTHLSGMRNLADLVQVENVPVTAAAPPSTGAGDPGWTLRDVQTTYVISAPKDFESYWASIGTKVRNSHTRRVKKLKSELNDAVAMRKFTAASEMRNLHEQMTSIWKTSWHSAVGDAPPPAIATLEELAHAGFVRSYVLELGGRPASYVCGYQYRGIFYYEAVAFDDKWRSFGPGTVLNYFMLQDLLRLDIPTKIDFGVGYNRYKEELGNMAQERGTLWLPMSWSGRAALQCRAQFDRARSLAKSVAARAGAFGWLRRQLRSKTAAATEGAPT